MGIKQYKPTSPGSRFKTSATFEELTPKAKPQKSLTKGKKRSSGRNNKGEITIWHRGGGHKRRYREIDFKRDKSGVPAKVVSVLFPPTLRFLLPSTMDEPETPVRKPMPWLPAPAAETSNTVVVPERLMAPAPAFSVPRTVALPPLPIVSVPRTVTLPPALIESVPSGRIVNWSSVPTCTVTLSSTITPRA